MSCRIVWASALAVILGPQCLPADDPQDDTVVTHLRSLLEPIEMQRLVGEIWVPAALTRQPILRFEELSRDNSTGSVWIWGEAGRPAAIIELYQPAQKPEDWVYVVNNLSGGTVRARRESSLWWQQNDSAVEMKPVPNTPAPAMAPTTRRIQMRGLARRFTAHEFWDPNNSRYNLRLLPRPLHRYSDKSAGVIDGMLFVLANGTNPEACLIIEARSESETLTWQYGFARLGHAEIHAELDEESIWTVPRLDSTPNGRPYWLFYTNIPGSSVNP